MPGPESFQVSEQFYFEFDYMAQTECKLLQYLCMWQIEDFINNLPTNLNEMMNVIIILLS